MRFTANVLITAWILVGWLLAVTPMVDVRSQETAVVEGKGDEQKVPEPTPVEREEVIKEADRWIAQLRDQAYDKREEAVQALVGIYPQVFVHIERAARKASDPEVRSSLEGVGGRHYEGLLRYRLNQEHPSFLSREKLDALCSFAAPGGRITYAPDVGLFAISSPNEKDLQSAEAFLKELDIKGMAKFAAALPQQATPVDKALAAGVMSSGFKETPVLEVLNFFRGFGRPNIHLDPKIGEAGIGATKITLNPIMNQSFRDVLNEICLQAGLDWEPRGNEVYVAPAQRSREMSSGLSFHLLPRKSAEKQVADDFKKAFEAATPGVRLAYDDGLKLLMVACKDSAEFGKINTMLESSTQDIPADHKLRVIVCAGDDPERSSRMEALLKAMGHDTKGENAK